MIPLIRLQWQNLWVGFNTLYSGECTLPFFDEIRKLFCARDAHGSYFKPLTFTLVKGTG